VGACRDVSEALALGRVYERSGDLPRADGCYRRAADAEDVEVRGEALYRLGLRCRRERRFDEAADVWRTLLTLGADLPRTTPATDALRQFAAEALAIHQEHRTKDFLAARELAMFALEEMGETSGRRTRGKDGLRHRLARLDRKITRERESSPLFWG
jgi:tetratricopeptide (TPR) repeat protein